MDYRNDEFDVTHPLSSHLFFCHLYSTSITYDTFISDPLVLTTVTFVILYGAKNALTEKTITLRLIGAVVDSLRLKHLTVAALQDLVRGAEANGDGVKVLLLDAISLFECHISFYKEAFWGANAGAVFVGTRRLLIPTFFAPAAAPKKLTFN